jgi:hypothetical protein
VNEKRLLVIGLVLLAGCQAPGEDATSAEPADVERVQVTPESDARAIEIARAVVERMGGWDAWDDTRYVSWNFFGQRTHYWDRWTGDLRLEMPKEDDRYLVLMNAGTREGQVWRSGVLVEDPEEAGNLLQEAHKLWINDSYWMFMPYKLLDPGVTLKYVGEREMEDGRAADVLDLTFGDGVGYTPQNRYEVFVAKDSGLVEQWSFYPEAADAEPRFSMPWADWRQFGRIMLATSHGRGADWEIAVHDDLPRAVFETPEPVAEQG